MQSHRRKTVIFGLILLVVGTLAVLSLGEPAANRKLVEQPLSAENFQAQ